MSQEARLTFERPFQLWAYTVSHGQLLLRSPMTDVHATRVDVLFKDVRAMLVRDSYGSLNIREATADEAVRIQEATRVVAGAHSHYYVIDREPLNFVVAGAVATAEDTGTYSDPSTLFVKSNM